jgi:hypothetical protein
MATVTKGELDYCEAVAPDLARTSMSPRRPRPRLEIQDEYDAS